MSALDPRRRELIARASRPAARHLLLRRRSCEWILDNVDGVRAAAARGEAMFGTIDTWVIWNLTGGRDGGATSPTSPMPAARMLMDLRTRQWDDELLELFGDPARACCREIRSRPMRRSTA